MFRFAPLGQMLVLILAGLGSPPLKAQAPAPAAEKKPVFKQPSLLDLAKLYQEFDLPLPPKNAIFAITDEGTPPLHAPASRTDIHYQLCFAIGGPYPKTEYRVWSGLNVRREEALAVVFAKPPTPDRVISFLKLDRLQGEYLPESENYAELVFAIQCHLLGHFDLAKFFYRRCLKSDSRPMDQNLVLVAWNYWGTELGNPKRELALVAKKLRHLVDKHRLLELVSQGPPREKEEIEAHVQDHRSLLDRVELTLRTKPAKPGSIEALIDKLLVDRTAGNGYAFSTSEEPDEEEEQEQSPEENQKRVQNQKKSDPKAVLRNLGFAAIPLLIEHVDDKRIIRHPPLFQRDFVGISQAESGHLTTINTRSYRSIGSIVREILATFFELDQHRSEKADYMKAWNDIKTLKESDFVARKLETKSNLHWQFLHFARDRHINKSIDAYQLILRQNIKSDHLGFLIHAIADSELPVAKKIELLTPAARSGTMIQRYHALDSLFELDHAVFSKLCKENLETPPKADLNEVEERFHLNIIVLGLRSNDPGTQQTAEKWALELPLDLKLQVIWDVARYTLDERPALKARSFAFSFLEDKGVYKPAKENRRTSFTLDHSIDQIEIRNLLALHFLEIMQIDISVSNETTEETWAKIRVLAKDEIDRRLENKSKQ